MKKHVRFLILMLFLTIPFKPLYGLSLSLPSPGYNHTVGTAVSVGVFLDKPAWFLGWSIDYSYAIRGKWILLGGLAYDQEHKTKSSGNERKVIHTLTPNVAVGYAFTPKVAVGIGLGKALWDTDNPEQKMQFTNTGNLTIGLLTNFTVFSKGPHSIDISGGLERGLITPETDVTVELGYGFSFGK